MKVNGSNWTGKKDAATLSFAGKKCNSPSFLQPSFFSSGGIMENWASGGALADMKLFWGPHCPMKHFMK